MAFRGLSLDVSQELRTLIRHRHNAILPILWLPLDDIFGAFLSTDLDSLMLEVNVCPSQMKYFIAS